MERSPLPFDSIDRIGTAPACPPSHDAQGSVRLGSSGQVIQPERLTRRELEVIEMLTRGWSNKRIASELSITQDTVKWHLKSAYRKFGVRCRLGAVCVASQLGLINFP